MVTVKIYEHDTSAQIAEIPMHEILDDGWTLEDFVEFQAGCDRQCVIVEGGDKTGYNIRIGVTSGMEGRFPVMYNTQTHEPISTGLTCKDWNSVVTEAIEWAKNEFGDEWREYCDVTEENYDVSDRPNS